MGRRRQPDHHQVRTWIPEPGERPGPVALPGIPARRVGRNLLAPGHQSRAAPAPRDATLEGGEGGGVYRLSQYASRLSP